MEEDHLRITDSLLNAGLPSISNTNLNGPSSPVGESWRRRLPRSSIAPGAAAFARHSRLRSTLASPPIQAVSFSLSTSLTLHSIMCLARARNSLFSTIGN